MMNLNNAQNLLAANCGSRRVTLGWDDDAELRELSDACVKLFCIFS